MPLVTKTGPGRRQAHFQARFNDIRRSHWEILDTLEWFDEYLDSPAALSWLPGDYTGTDADKSRVILAYGVMLLRERLEDGWEPPIYQGQEGAITRQLQDTVSALSSIAETMQALADKLESGEITTHQFKEEMGQQTTRIQVSRRSAQFASKMYDFDGD